MEIRSIIITILIFIVGSIILHFALGSGSLGDLRDSISSTFSTNTFDLKEFNENPEKYLGEQVEINAEFVHRRCHYNSCGVFANEEGYEIIVISDRHFKFNEWYEIKGKIIYKENYIDEKEYVLVQE